MIHKAKELIQSWGLPQIEELKNRELSFVFNSAELKMPHRLCEDLHCRDGSFCFCLCDTKTKDVAFVLNFFSGPSMEFIKMDPYIKLDTVVVIDPSLRNMGIASYYLTKVKEYAENQGIRLIKIHVDSNNDAFKNLSKDKILPNKKLKDFYRKYLENERISVEFI